MKRLFKYTLPALIACPMMLAACSEWTEPESITLRYPSIEEQNPELYAQYLESLNAFKASEHSIVIVSMNNLSTAPANQSQHLTALPDSVDYICLNNIFDVNEMHITEMDEVRKKGTKVVGLVDFDAIESAWQAILKKEAEDAANAETPEEGSEPESNNESESEDETTDEDPAIVNARRFIEYCKKETARQLDTINALGTDGIVMNFTGFDLNSLLQDEEKTAAETERQGAFFNLLAEWKVAHADKELIFKGSPQNVIDKEILVESRYIIINAHSAKNLYEMSYLVLMASGKDVPTDRFIMEVTTPYISSTGDQYGLVDGASAIVAAAEWTLQEEVADYVKAGISIDGVEQDYFNPAKIYTNVREAINILSPTAK